MSPPGKFFMCLFLALVPLAGMPLKAQNKSVEENQIRSTGATDHHARPDAKKHQPKKKKLRYIIKSNSKNTLKGNQCFEAVTRNFGFEYLIAPEDYPPNRNGISRWFHNAGVHFILFFRNGPGWQCRLKKKYRLCKYRYGDFTG